MQNRFVSTETHVEMPNVVKTEVTNCVTVHPACSSSGFSLIELLVVICVIGIIAAVAVPHLQRAIRATENSNMFATLRTVGSTEVSYYSQHGRFGRITEINNVMGGAIGTQIGNEVDRGKFAITMSPDNPSDLELKSGFTITATRNIAGEGTMYVYQLTQSGEITQILP